MVLLLYIYLFTARVEIQWHLVVGDPPETIDLLPAVFEEDDDEFIDNPLSGDPNNCISELSNRPDPLESLIYAPNKGESEFIIHLGELVIS